MSRILPILTTFLVLGTARPAPAEDAWRFVLPPPGDPFEHPPLRAIALRTSKPDDVRELVAYRGTRRRYAQLRYGSPGSVRVTVVLDELGPGGADLYVDADRNRRIEARDLVRGEGRTWRLPLDAATVAGEVTEYTRRALIFRRGTTGLTLSLAAAGYLEGEVRIGGRTHAARRADGDADGALTGPQDRLWIDLDDDGRWDPVAEQFLYATVLAVGEARYAVRSDVLGTWLAMEPLEGAGSVRLALGRPEASARVAEISATLVGREGSVVMVSGTQAPATVPVGEYRVHAVTLSLDDPGGGPRWGFVFSDDGGRSGQGWHKVEKGGAVVLDPIGTLDFRPGDAPQTCRAGDGLELQPRLYTGGGLLINTCYRGSPTNLGGEDGPGAEIALISDDGRTLASARSGFA
jgi:hypothetical protein